MTTSETIIEITKALIELQAELKPAKKDSLNPHFKSTYADLTSVMEAVKPLLKQNGLAVSQVNDGDILVTYLLHKSGEFITSKTPILYADGNPQKFGSGMTYARRYALAAILGVCTEDDDANEAVKPEAKPAKKSNPAMDFYAPLEAKQAVKQLTTCQEYVDRIKYQMDCLKIATPQGLKKHTGYDSVSAVIADIEALKVISDKLQGYLDKEIK